MPSCTTVRVDDGCGVVNMDPFGTPKIRKVNPSFGEIEGLSPMSSSLAPKEPIANSGPRRSEQPPYAGCIETSFNGSRIGKHTGAPAI